ncbi:MAG TPA: SRPBCC domain-containing protein, partial [Aggregatilineales bacterium]|nr:SRPBCC domain-containing protein [Aggregatilineales bacterium]
MSVTVTRTFPVSPKTMYYMLTNEDGLAYWFGDRVYTRPQVGGHLLHSWTNNWHMTGEFTELVENERVAFTWRDAGDEAKSNVIYQLEAVDGGTKVTVTHDNIPAHAKE